MPRASGQGLGSRPQISVFASLPPVSSSFPGLQGRVIFFFFFFFSRAFVGRAVACDGRKVWCRMMQLLLPGHPTSPPSPLCMGRGDMAVCGAGSEEGEGEGRGECVAMVGAGIRRSSPEPQKSCTEKCNHSCKHANNWMPRLGKEARLALPAQRVHIRTRAALAHKSPSFCVPLQQKRLLPRCSEVVASSSPGVAFPSRPFPEVWHGWMDMERPSQPLPPVGFGANNLARGCSGLCSLLHATVNATMFVSLLADID